MATSVIIPVFQAAGPLASVLDALAASSAPPREIIVVDDGSTDGSGDVARAAGVRVERVPGGPRGPAVARNLGAAAATSDVLLFLDADVLVHQDTVARVERHMAAHPDLAALFGSYDDRPAHPALISQYRNLLHHFVHQGAHPDAWTFWAGCGAVRRQVFDAVGGFDERFARPSIEDIELGSRLRRAGHRIRVCADVQVTHLKRWTLRSMLTTDIRDRAIPWTRLLLDAGDLPADLNVDVRSRLSAVLAWLVPGGFAAATVTGVWGLAAAAASAAGLLLINRRLYALFWRRGGVRLTAVGSALHTLYYLYSSATFATVALTRFWTRRAP